MENKEVGKSQTRIFDGKRKQLKELRDSRKGESISYLKYLEKNNPERYKQVKGILENL